MKTRYLFAALWTGTAFISAELHPAWAQRETPAPNAAASSSAAQNPPFTPPTNLEQGEQFFKQGMDAKKKADWTKALELFKRAHEIMPHWLSAANLGEAELMLGRARDAAEHLDWALGEAAKAKATAEALAFVQAKLDEAKAKVVTITLVTEGVGLDLYVDGGFVGKSPLMTPVYVEPGRRVFEAKGGSGLAMRQEEDFVKGGMARVVRLGGEKGKSTPKGKEEAAGEWRAPSWMLGLGGGLSGVGLGMGVAFWQAARQAFDDAENYGKSIKARGEQQVLSGVYVCTDERFKESCEEHKRLKGIPGPYQTRSMMAFGIGGALFLGTIALAVIPPLLDKKTTGAMDVSPMVGTQYQGMQISGTF